MTDYDGSATAQLLRNPVDYRGRSRRERTEFVSPNEVETTRGSQRLSSA